MKKTKRNDTATARKQKRLELRKEILRNLDPDALGAVNGGMMAPRPTTCTVTVKPPGDTDW